MKKIFLSILVSAYFSVAWGSSLSVIKDCPETPNCISSKASKPSHFIPPLIFTKSSEEFQEFVEIILKNFPRTKLIRMDQNYAHIEFTTLIMRFTDDLELLFDSTESKIHIRSASRVGYSDLGTNKKRVLKIKELLNKP